MKKILLFLFVLIIFHSSVFSQYRKGLFYMDANFNYVNKSDISSELGPEDIKSTFAPNVGYFVAKNFVVGVGLRVDYRNQSVIVQGMTAYRDNILFESDHITNGNIQTGIAPVVFAKYIYPVTRGLSVSLMINSFKGWQNHKTYQEIKDMVTGYVTPYVTHTDSAQYEGFTITPEIRCLLTNRLGVQLNFNGFSMSDNPATNPLAYNGYTSSYMYQSESTRKHILYIKSTSINFNPLNWSLGVFVVLGKLSNHTRVTF